MWINVLFICRSNAERSQIAEILFNYRSKRNKAISAGINVKKEKAIGAPAGRVVTELLLSMGHSEVTKARRKQLTEALAKRADRVIVILSKKELKELPDYIRRSPKTVYWNGRMYKVPKHVFMEFPPRTYRHHIIILQRIIDKVDDLVDEIG